MVQIQYCQQKIHPAGIKDPSRDNHSNMTVVTPKLFSLNHEELGLCLSHKTCGLPQASLGPQTAQWWVIPRKCPQIFEGLEIVFD